MALIKCDNLALGYEGQVILDIINFEVNSGDYLCIVGENGAGKSTLMKTILKLKKPMGGSILTGDDLKQKEIGYLPQQTPSQKDFPASVFEVVLSGRLNSLGFKPFFTRKDRLEAHDKLHLLGIDNIMNQCYNDLSGGQKQRVLLARAMCATKKLIVLDEPVAGLDPIATEDLYEAIRKINKEYGITIIMVSHDMEAAIKYSSHILHLSHKGSYYGRTEDYLKSNLGRKFLQAGGVENV